VLEVTNRMVYSELPPKTTARKKVRVPDITAAKGARKLTSLTCYDATFARLLERTTLDFVLVGDSLGNVIQGRNSTLNVTVEDIAYHVRCVAAALRTPLLVADMPFCAAGFDAPATYRNAETLMRAGAEAVKIEGATPALCAQIQTLTALGIPVMGHVGLTPQSVHALGGHKVQGKTDAARIRLVDEAKRLEDAGVFAIVLELVTPEVAVDVTAAVHVPTVGIGAGAGCDGQILVLHDMLGLNKDFRPKFLKHFASLEDLVVEAVGEYCREVADSTFPTDGRGHDEPRRQTES
jgi:3-methyl-2-oxobutanoate hydroxymethyltransferase